MSSQRYRLSGGTTICTDTPLSFTFDGKSYHGYKGDTLASALIAAGVHLIGRSFKYHRPRGIMSAGPEEPNALVRVGTGAYAEPNLKATQVELYGGLIATSQNRFPSLKYDVGSINSVMSQFLPAGFYYKTFMWPASFWMTYEHFIRNAAGLGKVASDPIDPERYEKTHRHCEILIAGGGGAGLMAAYQAALSGQRVMLVDEQAEFGGWLLSDDAVKIDNMPAHDWVREMQSLLSNMDNVTLLPRTTMFGYGDHNYITL
ncbi:MAG: 2Fe-2S iron-sulfur cluster-binding protein, partial [Alphaproteobacteria bacterium]|nr:2Fe-2S iron-sulfur cluster-binding protein [Alphaproteobacteria bacterium]